MSAHARAQPVAGTIAAEGLLPRHASANRGALRKRTGKLLGLAGAFALLVLVTLASLAVGTKDIPLSTVIDAFTSYDPTNPDHLIVRTLREPRTELGLAVGLALGLAGVLMQGIARNPLADPGILGVSGGAALFVVIGIYALGVSSPSEYVWLAFAGAAIASVVVYSIGALGREGATPVKLALAGAALTAVLTSLTTTVLLLDAEALDRFRFWVVGSLVNPTGTVAWEVIAFIAVGALMALCCGRLLNTLSLGEDIARALGQRVAFARAFAALAIVLLCGAAVALAGPIVFVGLAVPHIARAIVGPDYRWVLLYSALLAPALLLGADILGRVVARPAELQVGIVTALLGAPFFVLLVRRRKLAEI